MTREPRDHNPRTIAVVGANGWIGQAVAHELASRGHRILAVSRRPPGRLPPQADWRRVRRRVGTRELALALDGASAVINAAGAAHLSGDEAGDATFANEELPGIVGAATVTAGIPRLLHLSSIKALGEGGSAPLRTTDVPNPTTPYGRSKLAGEHALLRATAGAGTKFTIVRPPMVYGPGAPANFARLARLAQSPFPVPLPVPFPRRSVIFQRNLAALLTHLALVRDPAQLVHAADTPHLTTRDLVRHLSRAAGARDFVLPLPVRFARPLAKLAGRQDDITRLTRDLVVEHSEGAAVAHWSPPFPNHQGFRHTVEVPQ